MANARDSDSEPEEYFPTPLPTPVVVTALQRRSARQLATEETGSLHYSFLEGRTGTHSPSPPALLPVTPAVLAADVEQVRLRAHHGIVSSKVTRTVGSQTDPYQENRANNSARPPENRANDYTRPPENRANEYIVPPTENRATNFNRPLDYQAHDYERPKESFANDICATYRQRPENTLQASGIIVQFTF